MAWNSLSFDFGAILSSSQMNQMYANFGYLAAGSSGAPTIVNDALNSHPWSSSDLNNSIITRQKLLTYTTAQTGSLAATGTATITLPAYCFAWSLTQTGGAGGPLTIRSDGVNPADADAPKFIIVNESASFSVNYSVAYRYIGGP